MNRAAPASPTPPRGDGATTPAAGTGVVPGRWRTLRSCP